MTELEIDQSHLPQVQKVCQCFAVLEDGALAHNLQEQEIEQYYTSNVQKNQLVQKDVRIARRLQDEEERAVLLSQASRQLEEQDFEYARMIQEEIRRCAEEARRREEEDEEMAKRIQEEEEMDVRRRKLESGCHGNTNGFPLNEEHPSPPDPPPSPHYAPATFCPSLGEASHRHSTTRGQCLVSHTGSDSVTEPLNPISQNNSAPQLGLGPPAILRLIKNDLSDSHRLGKNSGDEVFLAMPSIVANRPWKHLRNSPCTQQSHMQEGWIHSIHCGSRKEGNVRGQGEGIVGLGWEGSHYSSCGADLRSAGKGDRSGRYTDLCPLDKIHSWTYSEGRATGGRHVRFQDEGRAFHSYHGDRRRVSLGSSHNGGPGDRCVVGSHGYHGDLAQGTGDLRVDHVQSDIERAAGQLMQSDKRWHSYRGNNGKYSQRGSCKEHGQMGGPGRDLVRHHEGLTNKGASHWANKDWDCNSRFPQTGNAGYHRDGVERKGGACDSHRNQRQRGGGAAHANGNQGGGATRKVNRRVRGRASGRWRGSVEESSSEEEEEEVLQREERRKRGLRRNASVSKRAAGAELWQRGACLELGALQQVLLDEELARRLQEEEDQIHRKSPRSPISLHTSGTEADFRAAQVAQDEEIARYIQRQEVKTKRRSHDLEAQELRRNCGDTGNSCEMRLTRERKLQVPRERLDSEGLTSPTEDRTPEHQPPSPVNTPLQRQAIRNIAEELDPTFKARRKNSCPAGLTSPGLCQAPLTPNRIFQDYMEEPMFIPPTKRNSEKSGRGKAKEKKEGCKQQ